MNGSQILRYITQAWLVLVVAGSLQPTRLLGIPASQQRTGRPHLVVGPSQTAGPGTVVILHREIHWLAFGGAAFLLLLLSRSRRQEISRVIAVCLLGLSLEYLQLLIYHNPMEWFDVRDDALAILVALTLYRLAGTPKLAFQGTALAPTP